MIEYLILADLESTQHGYAVRRGRAVATVLTLAMPLLAGDDLSKRMRAVALEREKIRQRERERLARGEKVALRRSPKQYMQTIVNELNLGKWVGQEEARALLVQAGHRGQAPYITFLFFRLLSPIQMLAGSAFYIFFVTELDQPTSIKVGICIVATYLGMYLPILFLKNKIQKRQLTIKRAFPDALDLLLICVESGMSVEAGFRKVAGEIGTQSIPLAEELTLTTAELSYLQDRRQAYENLAKRTNLEGVKSVCMALQQAERYGTPMAQTLRVMAQENRDMRMSEAEKKAAALPPKLTVPMILFFLPVLFIVILSPAAIRSCRQPDELSTFRLSMTALRAPELACGQSDHQGQACALRCADSCFVTVGRSHARMAPIGTMRVRAQSARHCAIVSATLRWPAGP
jgi:tight adherence protein C